MNYVKDVIWNYGMSVQQGHHHIYQALPRLLTVWFEFGTHCVLNMVKPTKQVCFNLLTGMAISLTSPESCKLILLVEFGAQEPAFLHSSCHPSIQAVSLALHIVSCLLTSWE